MQDIRLIELLFMCILSDVLFHLKCSWLSCNNSFCPLFHTDVCSRNAETIFSLTSFYQYYEFRVLGDKLLFSDGEFKCLFIGILQLSSDFSKRSIIFAAMKQTVLIRPCYLVFIRKKAVTIAQLDGMINKHHP